MLALRKTAIAVALSALGSVPSATAQQSQIDRTDRSAATNQTRGTDQAGRHDATQEQGTPLAEALAQKLNKANKGEIELAKLAQQKSDEPEIKQLTETIISDHSQLNKQLEQFCQSNSTDRSAKSSTENSTEKRSSTTEAKSDRTAASSVNRSDSPMVPRELCQLMEKACDNSLQMTKQMLEQYDGQDFTMAYLGQQIVAHTMMLAELKAIESDGPESLHSIAQAAIKKTENHLEKAKQLAMKYEDKERRGS